MKQRQKKGFTIVELLVVIAVIAVLAAVLIPVMVYLIDDAKTSADEQTVASLNKLIASETGDFETASDAVEAANDVGYNLETLDLDSDNELVWDQGTGYFALIDEDGEEVYSNGTLSDSQYLWKIVSSDEEVTTATAAAGEDGTVTLAARTIVASAATDAVYSYYLTEGYEPEITFSAGVDAGKNEGLDLEVETSLSGILVNGNGGTVTISGSGSVTFYGEANYLAVESGSVTTAAGSSVNTIVYESGATVTVNGECGVSQEVDDISALNTSDFAGGLGTVTSPYEIATAEQFEAIGNLSSDMISTAYYFKLTADITVVDTSGYVSTYFQGELDGDGHSITLGTTAAVNGGSYLFGYNTGDATIKNLVLEEYTYVAGLIDVVNYFSDAYGDVTFKDITIQNAEGLDSSALYKYQGAICCLVCYSGGETVTFSGITNKAAITSTEYTGLLIGNYFFIDSNYKNDDGTYSVQGNLAFVDCCNKGTIKGVEVGFFTGNIYYVADVTNLVESADFSDAAEGMVNVYISGCGNSGTIRGTSGAGAFSAVTNGYTSSVIDEINETIMNDGRFLNTGTITVSSYDVSLALDGDGNVAYSDTITGQSYYTITALARISFAGTEDEDGTISYSGSSYVKLFTVTDTYADYVTKMIGDTEYESAYGVAYSDISATEETSVEGYDYKLVTLDDGTVLAVVNLDEIPETVTLTNPSLSLTTVTYQLNVFDSDGTVIASARISAKSIS